MIRKFQLLTLSLVCLLVLLATTSQAQITPSKDAYTNSADPTTNFGANVLLDVDGASQITYIQFDLASVPSGTGVRQAALKLYVNGVTTAGSFDVDYVNGTWSEGTITSSLAPALGGVIASGISITAADKNQYILINVTPAVQAWLDGSQANDGLALVANSTFNASFDSKENTSTSHAPELDIVFAGNTGTITGATTATGSGLTGGGTNGTLNLSLLKTCANGQVLEWSGTAWACATAEGTGTITGVTAGTDLTGGGTSGKVTLNLDTTKVPLLIANNIFTGSQGVIGSFSVTTPVPGIHGGIGNFSSPGARDSNSVTVSNGTGTTETFQSGGPDAFVPGTNAGDGGLRVTPGKNIFFGDSKASRLELDSAGNASQPLAAGGMAKAMVFVFPDSGIINCFNSFLTGSAATTPPCGFGFVTDLGVGNTEINFGFKVDNRFLLATAASGTLPRACTDTVPGCVSLSSTEVYVQTFNPSNFDPVNDYYWLIVY